MKRVLSCLTALVLMLLPVFSLAQGARNLSIAYTLDADEILRVSEALGLEGTEDDEQMARAVCTLVNSASLSVMMQDGGVRAALSLQGTEVLWGAVTWDGEQVSMTSSLLPGCAAVVSLDQVNRAVAAAKAVDWESLAAELMAEASSWASALDSTDESGSFIGDAYEGGTHRVTWRADDRDLALLIDGLILRLESRDDVGALLDILCEDMVDGGAQGAYEAFRTYDHHVALENRYAYVFSEASNAKGDAVGYSLTVLDGGEQTGTASLGVREDGARLVTGISLGNGQTDWTDLDVTARLESDGMDFAYDFAKYLSDAEDGFQAAVLDPDSRSVSASMEGQALWNASGSTVSATTRMTQNVDGAEMKGRVEETAVQTVDPYTSAAEMRAFYMDGDVPAVVCRTEGSESPAFAQKTDDLTELNMEAWDDETQDLLDASLEKGVKALMVKLFKNTPTECFSVLTTLMNLGN